MDDPLTKMYNVSDKIIEINVSYRSNVTDQNNSIRNVLGL